MNKRDDKKNSGSIGLDFLRLIGTVAGGTIAYIITSNLPSLISALACAMAIALSSLASTRFSHPILWWANVGAVAGAIAGTGVVLADLISHLGLPNKVSARYTIIGFLSIAGLVSGIFLGRNLHRADIPHPKDFLKVASGLTAGIFAAIVTVDFTLQGLEQARTLSSRLSAVTTILVTALAVPGWLGYQIGRLLSAKGKPANHRRR